MTSPDAGGHRYLVTAETLSIKEIGDELRNAFPAYRFKLPWLEAPSWIVRLMARFDAERNCWVRDRQFSTGADNPEPNEPQPRFDAGQQPA